MQLFPKKILLFIFLILFFLKNTNAQDVTGKWYGIGDVNVENSTSNYLCELILIQNGNRVTGYFNYFFRDAYITNYINGSFDPVKHQLHINAIPILYYLDINPGNGVDCKMGGSFKLSASSAESSLAGSFESDEFHKFTSPPINIHFVKQTKDEPELKEIVEEKKTPPPETPQEKIEYAALKQLNMRRKDIVRILDFTDDSVEVNLYDNGDFDYDTATVFFNNRLIEYKQLLQVKTPITFHLALDSVAANNDLVMFAENLGQIPPNSGIMIITDKTHRYEVSMESDYIKSAAVRLRKVAQPKYAPYKL
jgi:hypothetical protein